MYNTDRTLFPVSVFLCTEDCFAPNEAHIMMYLHLFCHNSATTGVYFCFRDATTVNGFSVNSVFKALISAAKKRNANDEISVTILLS